VCASGDRFVSSVLPNAFVRLHRSAIEAGAGASSIASTARTDASVSSPSRRSASRATRVGEPPPSTASPYRNRRIALAEPVQDERQSANCGLLQHRRRAGGSESLQHASRTGRVKRSIERCSAPTDSDVRSEPNWRTRIVVGGRYAAAMTATSMSFETMTQTPLSFWHRRTS
jgi:hypothetical protein